MAAKGRRDRTIATHAGNTPKDNHGVVNPPIYRASTILFPTVKDMRAGYKRRFDETYYGRYGTPTTQALKDAFTELEGSERAVIVPSGLGAVSAALLSFLNPGDHLLMVDSVYEPSRGICDGILKRFGVETTYYDPNIGAGIEQLVRPNTKVIYMESPGSQTFEVQDVPAIVAIAKKRNCVTMLDNTWATPLYFKPPKHDIDVSIYAATKYICGHSDIMMGIITTRQKHHYQVAMTAHNMLGHYVSPDECYMALRGLRTLHARLTQHQECGLKLAKWLASRPEVERVLHPALSGTPGHEFWKRDFAGASGLFGVVLKPVSQERIEAMLDGMELFPMGFSWGGYESLMVPCHLEHARTARPWPAESPVVRIHAGLEDPEDLIADLERGFDRLRGNAS